MEVNINNPEDHVFTTAWVTQRLCLTKTKQNMQDKFLGQFSYKRGGN